VLARGTHRCHVEPEERSSKVRSGDDRVLPQEHIHGCEGGKKFTKMQRHELYADRGSRVCIGREGLNVGQLCGMRVY